jgi:hypothetical protein
MFRHVQPPVVRNGFPESRRKLLEILSQLTFMRVSVVTYPPDTYRSGTHFQGDATEIFPGRTSGHQHPRIAFFSRYGRQTGTGLNVLGGFTLIDSPVGGHHNSSTPQIGDILVGSLMPAAKGKIPFELRGWCNNAKPLMELCRIVQFGTKMPEDEVRRCLRQPASESAYALLRLSASSLSQQETLHATKASNAADDFFCMARVVCFGKLEERTDLKLSRPFVELVDSLAMRFGDEQFIDDWSKVRPKEYKPQEEVSPATVASMSPYSAMNLPNVVWSYTAPSQPLPNPTPTTAAVPPAISAPQITYTPTTPEHGPYVPSSPPCSPIHYPQSPKEDE